MRRRLKLALLSTALFSLAFCSPAQAIHVFSENGNSSVCLYWAKREAKEWFGYRNSHAMVCFDLTPGKAPAFLPGTGAVMRGNRMVKCTVDAKFYLGTVGNEQTGYNDSMEMTFCNKVLCVGDMCDDASGVVRFK